MGPTAPASGRGQSRPALVAVRWFGPLSRRPRCAGPAAGSGGGGARGAWGPAPGAGWSAHLTGPVSGPADHLAERLVAVEGRFPRQPAGPLADPVALHLVR